MWLLLAAVALLPFAFLWLADPPRGDPFSWWSWDNLEARARERRCWILDGRPLRADHWWDDPLGYCEFHLRVKLWSKQIEVIEKMMTPPYKVLVRSGHSTGKSFLASCLASWFYDSWPESITVITSATAKNIKDVIFAELRKRRPGDRHMLPKNPVLRQHDDHWIEGYTSESGEAYSGRHRRHMMFQFDESTDIDPEFWKATYGMFIGNGNMYWLCWCNPTDQGSQFAIEEAAGTWHLVEISQLEHPNVVNQLRGDPIEYPGATELAQVLDILNTNSERIPDAAPEEEDEIRLEYADGRVFRYRPSPEVDIRVRGIWQGTAGSNVWSHRLFAKMLATRHILNKHWRIVIGCDLAAFGDDDTVIMVMWGPIVLHLERHNGWSPAATRLRLKALCEYYAQQAGRDNPFHKGDPKTIPVYLDAGGDRHLAVTEYSDGYNFIGVNPSEEAIAPDEYYNRRSELWFFARKMAEDGAIDISALSDSDKQQLKLELTAPHYALDNRMRRRVEEKAITKKRLRKSPDKADAFNLMLSGWQPIGA